MKIQTTKTALRLVTELDEKTKDKKSFKWHYLYILHYIHTYGNFNSKFKDEVFIPINVQKLRSMVSYDHTTKLLANLVAHDILETDSCYIVGRKSKCYKVIDEIRHDKWFSVDIEDLALDKKLTELFFKEKINLFSDKKGYGKVTKTMEKLQLDKQTALEFISKQDLTNTKKFSYKTSVEMFENKFSVRDDISNRLHNNLTNLPSGLRQFLTLDGENLYQVDIKCSQPTFLGLYLRKRGLADQQEVEKFLNVCKNGDIYSQLILEDKSRKEKKIDTFKYCFFNRVYKNLNVVEKRFQELYPTIFKEMQKMKQNDYKDLSILLQKEESSFIFEVVNSLDFDVVTIHDSILAKKSDISKVENKIREKFVNIYNFLPHLSAEKC